MVSEKHIRTQNLATAVWIAERKEARVQVPKGKIFQSLGYFEASQQYLDPLEILFLVDRGILELRVQGKIASVQLAYELAITTGVDWNSFLVYAHLRRLGFVVRKPEFQGSELAASSLVRFGVWKPGTWKRKAQRKPSFYCIVCSFLDPPFLWEQVQAVCKQLSPISVRIATVVCVFVIVVVFFQILYIGTLYRCFL